MNILHRIACGIAHRVTQRKPDFYVGGKVDPYLVRWYVFGARADGTSRTFLGLFRVYVHTFRHSDDDRALHDHPAASFSIGLYGSAVEHTIAAGGVHHRRQLRPGGIRFRSARFAHRIELLPEVGYATLFIFFRNTREWGFHCPNGWVPWREFVSADDKGAIGRGCGE